MSCDTNTVCQIKAFNWIKHTLFRLLVVNNDDVYNNDNVIQSSVVYNFHVTHSVELLLLDMLFMRCS